MPSPTTTPATRRSEIPTLSRTITPWTSSRPISAPPRSSRSSRTGRPSFTSPPSRASAAFGEGFATYLRDNLLATQRLFEAAVATRCGRVVWASSSSVYGDAAAYPCREHETPTAPRSPYGMTKRACEDLAGVYRVRGLDAVGLRYFTVYGPRQRPDTAIRRLCEAALRGRAFPVYGDGRQIRDFTFVTDVVDATVRAAQADAPPAILNVGGRESAMLLEIIRMVEELAGTPVRLEHLPVQGGDVRRTGADTTLARARLGWSPQVNVREGLSATVAWAMTRTDATQLVAACAAAASVSA
jgi:UDP-glucuronate 4-epimerase